jgi:hypothetical protein
LCKAAVCQQWTQANTESHAVEVSALHSILLLRQLRKQLADTSSAGDG